MGVAYLQGKRDGPQEVPSEEQEREVVLGRVTTTRPFMFGLEFDGPS